MKNKVEELTEELRKMTIRFEQLQYNYPIDCEMELDYVFEKELGFSFSDIDNVMDILKIGRFESVVKV